MELDKAKHLSEWESVSGRHPPPSISQHPLKIGLSLSPPMAPFALRPHVSRPDPVGRSLLLGLKGKRSP